MCEWATEVVIANYDEFEIQGYEEVLVAPTCLGGGVVKDSVEVLHSFK